MLIAVAIALVIGGVLWWRNSRASGRTTSGIGPRGLPTRTAAPAQ